MGEGLGETWNDRVESWHHHVTNSPAFEAVREEVFRRAAADWDARCLDLGAGTGFRTLPLAERVGHVVAVDIAPAMTEDLERRAKDKGLANVKTMACDLTSLRSTITPSTRWSPITPSTTSRTRRSARSSRGHAGG